MGTFNVYDHLIVPLNEKLEGDQRFAGMKIIYDRTADRQVPRDLMPAINFFFESPFDDLTRGSGAYSLQARRMTVRLGFGIWIFDSKSPASLDRALFQVSSDLLDFFREMVDFDQPRGIAINQNIRVDVDYSGDETGMVGTQKLAVEFEFMGGQGR